MVLLSVPRILIQCWIQVSPREISPNKGSVAALSSPNRRPARTAHSCSRSLQSHFPLNRWVPFSTFYTGVHAVLSPGCRLCSHHHHGEVEVWARRETDTLVACPPPSETRVVLCTAVVTGLLQICLKGVSRGLCALSEEDTRQLAEGQGRIRRTRNRKL